MDKLRSMNSKQLGIFTAVVVAVLGVVGVLSGEMILQIVIAAVQKRKLPISIVSFS